MSLRVAIYLDATFDSQRQTLQSVAVDISQTRFFWGDQSTFMSFSKTGSRKGLNRLIRILLAFKLGHNGCYPQFIHIYLKAKQKGTLSVDKYSSPRWNDNANKMIRELCGWRPVRSNSNEVVCKIVDLFEQAAGRAFQARINENELAPDNVKVYLRRRKRTEFDFGYVPATSQDIESIVAQIDDKGVCSGSDTIPIDRHAARQLHPPEQPLTRLSESTDQHLLKRYIEFHLLSHPTGSVSVEKFGVGHFSTDLERDPNSLQTTKVVDEIATGFVLAHDCSNETAARWFGLLSLNPNPLVNGLVDYERAKRLERASDSANARATYKLALARLKPLLEDSPYHRFLNVLLLNNWANVCVLGEDRESAKQKFTQAINLIDDIEHADRWLEPLINRYHIYLHINRGTLFADQFHDWEGALGDYRVAIDHYPRTSEPYNEWEPKPWFNSAEILVQHLNRDHELAVDLVCRGLEILGHRNHDLAALFHNAAAIVFDDQGLGTHAIKHQIIATEKAGGKEHKQRYREFLRQLVDKYGC